MGETAGTANRPVIEYITLPGSGLCYQHMLKLTSSLNAWNTGDFSDVFINEVRCLGINDLPLQQGLVTGSYASADNLSVTILKYEATRDAILVKAGLFYSGIIAGCNCADDPSPIDEIPEYCEALFTINKNTAETRVTLLNQYAENN